MNNSKCMHNINRYKLGRHNVKGLDIVPLQKLISAINITYFLKQIQFHLNMQKTRLSIYLTTEKIISFMTIVQYHTKTNKNGKVTRGPPPLKKGD